MMGETELTEEKKTDKSGNKVTIVREKKKQSFADKLILKFNTWLVMKGWIYILVFIMGFLFGGLVFK